MEILRMYVKRSMTETSCEAIESTYVPRYDMMFFSIVAESFFLKR